MTRLHPLLSVRTKVALPRNHDREEVGFGGELTDGLSDGVSQYLWLLFVGTDNNPWGQYQPLIPTIFFQLII